MTDDFNLDNFIGDAIEDAKAGRLERQYDRIHAKGHGTDQIEIAVDRSLSNIVRHDADSFVIYGEPQSGKTEMMIALTAALLDAGHRTIFVLTNDSVQLLEQNLGRFQGSGLDPAAKKFLDILDPVHDVKESEWVVFAKKNSKDLQKLVDKVKGVGEKVIIDDEADYASPNGKVNKNEKTKINELIEKLLGKDGIYIGVTATPARLDLNMTFGNNNELWVDFPPHPDYTGQDVFFPTKSHDLENLEYRLVTLPDGHDDEKYLRHAVLSFMVNVAFLNESGTRPGDYSMLIHTSGNKVDHTADFKTVSSILGALSDSGHKRFGKLVQEAFDIAKARFGDNATALVQHIVGHVGQNNVVVMNSNSTAQQASYSKATDPTTRFTFAIGGNIVSRGVTFNNLLSMFFTRDTRHRIQQDTYIQRARMFGSRGEYLPWFELHIPKALYLDWQRCFVFHKLSLRGIREGLGAPLWLEDNRIKPAASASVKRSAVQWQTGEMYWEKFRLGSNVPNLVGNGGTGLALAESLQLEIGDEHFPPHVLDFIRNFLPYGDASIAIHDVQEIASSYTTANQSEITRDKGLMGTNQLERARFPRAIHHLKIFSNPKGEARVYYRYAPDPADVNVNSKNLSFVSRI